MTAIHEKVREDVMFGITQLHREATATYERIVVPECNGHGYRETLFGYVGRAFSYVDLLSAYWRGEETKPQAARMADFLEKYVMPGRRQHGFAIQIWRHKLFHTARPRPLLDPTTGKTIFYYLQWHEERMTDHQRHYTFVPFGSDRAEVFNLGCLPMIGDLRRAGQRFFDDVAGSAQLQAKVERHEATLGSYSAKPV